MTAFPLALFHGVHHGVIVALIGVEDFGPLFADFGDEWVVSHGFSRLASKSRISAQRSPMVPSSGWFWRAAV